MADEVVQGERNRLSRRQMIKASAVAGAAAWTAPVIIDSLSSPAAAGSRTHVISCSWFYVVFLKPGDATIYFTTADDSSSACANAHPPNNQGPNVKTCNGVTYSSGVTGHTSEILYGPTNTSATYVGAPACGTYIDIQGDKIQAMGDAILLAAFSHKGGSQCSPCPSPLNTANNSVGICSGDSFCD